MKNKPKKVKTNVVKNFLKSIKVVFKFDKAFILLNILSTILSSVSPYLYSMIILKTISVLEKENPTFTALFSTVWGVIALNLIFSIISKTINYALDPRRSKIRYCISLEMSLKTLDMEYEKLELPSAQEEYEKASRATGEWRGVCGVINRGFWLLESFITFLIGCGIILTVNPLLVFLVIFLAIIKLLLKRTSQRKAKAINDEQIPIWRKHTYVNNISRNLSIGKDLRIYNMDDFVNEEREAANNKLLKLIKKRTIVTSIYDALVRFLNALDEAFLYGFMVYEVLEKNMLISSFSFMISSVYQVISSLNLITTNYGYLYNCSLQADDYFRYMTDKYIDKNRTKDVSGLPFSVEFKNVYYQYYAQEGFALENISFKINKGEKIALVGYNGAGKTTLVKLLCGLYHPTKGNIYINGIDINDITHESLRKIIAPVFQDGILYSYNIEENVAMKYGENVDHEKVQYLLNLLDLKKKVETFEAKEKTLLTRDFDEKGILLSGGETQKLLIARAGYKEANLYILDEPTSAMDAISEANLYNNFNELVRNNAAIFISHRLASTKFCDRIVVLDHGKIKEEGTHKELMSSETLYKELFSMQANFYKDGGVKNE